MDTCWDRIVSINERNLDSGNCQHYYIFTLLIINNSIEILKYNKYWINI